MNKGCAFSSCSRGKRCSPGSCQAQVRAAEPWAGWQRAARAVSSHGVAHVQRVGGRSPVVNRQVPLLLVGIAVGLLAAVRKMPRSGWGGKLNFIAALCWSLAPQWYAGDLPGQSSPLYFTSAGGETEQVVSGAFNLVFLLSTKFSLEGFSLWQAGIFEEKGILGRA